MSATDAKKSLGKKVTMMDDKLKIIKELKEDDYDSDKAWLENIPRRGSRSSTLGSPNSPKVSKYETIGSGSFDTIRRRALTTQKSSFTMTKKWGRSLSMGVKGTIFDLSKNLFTDFPEIQFKEFPIPTIKELDKRQQKEAESLLESLGKNREKLLSERNAIFTAQQKREETLIKEFQEENIQKMKAELKSFKKKLKKAKRSPSGSIKKSPSAGEKETLSAEDEAKIAEFEESLKQALASEQEEFEKRLISQRIKWILPWIMHMKTTELVQYAQIHSLEVIHLEEMQRNERMTLQSEQNELMKQDMEGFEKDLKASKKERKKTDNPMTKEEMRLEKEHFSNEQEARFAEQKKLLLQEQKKRQEKLEQDQQRQLEQLSKHYETIEILVFSPDDPPETPKEKSKIDNSN